MNAFPPTSAAACIYETYFITASNVSVSDPFQQGKFAIKFYAVEAVSSQS